MKKLWALACGNPNIWTYQGKTTVSFCYLHGKLEHMNGYDIFEMDINDWNSLVEKGEGVEQVMVALSNGKIEVADIYFWKPTYYDKYNEAKVELENLKAKYNENYKYADFNEQLKVADTIGEAYSRVRFAQSQIECAPIRALVVLPWDVHNVEYAKQKQKERTEFL